MSGMRCPAGGHHDWQTIDGVLRCAKCGEKA